MWRISLPPSAVKTVKDLIYWQYAKIISKSAGMGKKNYGFIMSKFKDLQKGEIEWSTSIREYVKEREAEDKCIYCEDEKENLTLEHLLPLSREGPDLSENAVLVCQSCNSSKGDKRLYEWYADKEDMETASYDVPRIAEGKYLKLLHKLHKEKGTLNTSLEELEKLCTNCDMGTECPDEQELSLYCLEGIFTKKIL